MGTINTLPVKGSSNIAGIGYDLDQGTLAVEFTSGAVYHYLGVPPHVYPAFRNADSKGSFFHANVAGHYLYVRVDES